jgi:hypothetical protein
MIREDYYAYAANVGREETIPGLPAEFKVT